MAEASVRRELLGPEQIFAFGIGHRAASLRIGQPRDHAHAGGAYGDRVVPQPDRRVARSIPRRSGWRIEGKVAISATWSSGPASIRIL